MVYDRPASFHPSVYSIVSVPSMCGVVHGFQEVHITGWTTYIFRWASIFAGQPLLPSCAGKRSSTVMSSFQPSRLAIVRIGLLRDGTAALKVQTG